MILKPVLLTTILSLANDVDAISEPATYWTSFFIGILTSIIGSTIWFIIITLVSKRFRKFLYRVIDLVLHTDVHYVYDDYEQAKRELSSLLSKTKKVFIYTGRGNFLHDQEYNSVFDNTNVDVRIVLPVANEKNKWLIQRANEMHVINAGFTAQTLSTDIKNVAVFLEPSILANKIGLRYSDSQHIGKIIILDTCVFFTPYQSNKFGQDTKVYKYGAGTYMYHWLERYFMSLWEENAEPTA